MHTGSLISPPVAQVSDDGLYTVSVPRTPNQHINSTSLGVLCAAGALIISFRVRQALLREFQPRGYSFFDFTETATGRSQAVAIRGFRKFTGLSAEDGETTLKTPLSIHLSTPGFKRVVMPSGGK